MEKSSAEEVTRRATGERASVSGILLEVTVRALKCAQIRQLQRCPPNILGDKRACVFTLYGLLVQSVCTRLGALYSVSA